jgi:ankyrin repeat protein
LVEALRQGNLEEARRIVRSGAKLDVVDNYGDTPLFQAIRSGYSDFAEELLSTGADPEFTSGGGTALMVAAWYRDLRIARILLDRGVSVNAADAKGQTALMNASQTCLDGKMVQLLLDAGADTNAKTVDGFTALMSAASAGNALAAEKLLKAGADPRVKNKYGSTAEDEACDRGEKGHAQVCALLREALRRREADRKSR